MYLPALWLTHLILYTIFQSNSSGFVISANWNHRSIPIWSVGNFNRNRKTTPISWSGARRTRSHKLTAFIHSEEKTKNAAKNMSSNDDEVPPDSEPDTSMATVNGGAIEISASIELPFPKSVAYDAFSDLSRQSTYSPWLKSVEYIEGERNSVGSKTRWKLSYLGLRFAWNSISTLQDPTNGIIEWESITGLQNNGRVTFKELSDERSHMHMTMSFVVPRFAARVLGPHKLASIVEKRILENTVNNFRQIVVENDWKIIQQQRELEKRQQEQTSDSFTTNAALKSVVLGTIQK